MKLNRELISQLLPAYSPPETAFSNAYIEGPMMTRSFEWTTYIINQLPRLLNQLSIPNRDFPFFGPFYDERILDISIGFISLSDDRRGEKRSFNIIDNFVFGVQIYQKGNPNQPEQILSSAIDNIPIVIKHTYFETHSAPNPPGGTSACWVKSIDPENNWTKGVLTCGHVVATLPIPSAVPLIHNGTCISGQLVDRGYNCIDAAIIATDDRNWPKSLFPVSIAHPTAPGMEINLHLSGGQINGSILSLSTHMYYFGPQFSHRVFIDCHGRYTDSGSYVEQADGKALGMYLGTVDGANNTKEGFCQSLVQVQNYFGLDIYR